MLNNKRLNDAQFAVADGIFIHDVSLAIMAVRGNVDADVYTGYVEQFDAASKAGDMDAMRALARRLKVKTTRQRPTEPRQPEPSDPDDSDETSDSPSSPPRPRKSEMSGSDDGDKPPAWFSVYVDQFGATDADGKPTKAAAQLDLNTIEKRVENAEKLVYAAGFAWTDDGHLGIVPGSWADDADKPATKTFDTRWALLIGAIALVVSFLLFMFAGHAAFTSALIWTAIITVIVAGAAGLLVPLVRNRRKS